jgi:diguanylate cyclase (GGDEF)-like protein
MTFLLWQKIRARFPEGVPLRSVLIVPLVLQSIAMVGIVGYISYVGGYRSITVLLLCGLAVIMAIIIGNVIADWIIQPILQLNATAKQISNIYFVKPKSQTLIFEIQELNDCFAEMTEHLQNSFESLINQKLYVSHLLEAMPIGVAIHAADGSLTYLNEIGQDLLNKKLSTSQSVNSLNSNFQIYLENTDQPYPIDKLPSSQAIRGETCYIDNLEILREGKRIPLEAKAAPIFSIEGKVDGAIVVFRDISDRKNTEKILANYNQKLEQDVQQRTLDLQQEIQERQQVEIALRQIELELTKANQELARLASIDGLTKIANRRGFDDRLEFEWRRLMREAQPLSLILFDVDYFKLYNDHYGHQLGDRCLEMIAGAVDTVMCRPADMVARYGGEEFIVILPNTNLDGAELIASKIHQVVRDLAIPHQKSLVSEVVSVSLGISCLVPTLERSPDLLISQADQALYNAKHQGRNCSKIFDHHM